MKKSDVIKAITKLREEEKNRKKKRAFLQSFDLSIALKGINFKKPENKIDLIVQLPHPKTKDLKICALVDKELVGEAKKHCSLVIEKKDFGEYKSNPRKTRKLARTYDFFIAQANIMADIALTFGKFLGSKRKMPNPKAGLIVPPTAKLEALVKKLNKTIIISQSKAPVINLKLGTEDMPDEELAENVLSVYNAVEHALPGGKNQIRAVYVKFTMSKPVKVREE